MKVLRLSELGKATPVFDLEPCDLGLNEINYAKNYLLRDNKIYSFNGFSNVASMSSISGLVDATFYGGYVDYFDINDVKYYLVAGINTNSSSVGHVLTYDGATWTDLSNAGGYTSLALGDELKWTGCRIGPIPVINNPKHYPEFWSPQSLTQKMQFLKFSPTETWKDKGFRTNVIRSHNNFLFALGLTEGGQDFPNAYRWSHPADVNGLPYTWDETDLSSIAGKASVEGYGNKLIDGLSLRDAFALYTQRSMYVLDYTGAGDFVWNRRKLSHSHGVLTTNCVVEAVGNHLVLTDGDIVINDGNSITSTLTAKLKRFLEKNLSNDKFANCFAQTNYIDNEAWFFIVQPGKTYPSIVFIVNYVTGQVSIRDVQGKKAAAVFGQQLLPVQTWSSTTQTWTSIRRSYLENESSPFNDLIVALDTGPTQYTGAGVVSTMNLENLESNTNTVLGTVIERNNLSLEGQDNVTTILKAYPHIRSSGTVSIQFGSQAYLNAPISWKPAVVFTPNLQRHVSIRTTGKLHAWRISSIGTNVFELTGMDIEYEMAGKR